MKGSPLLSVAFALTFYTLGATFFESFVNYRTWHLIDQGSFHRYHEALTTLVVRVMLVPILIYFLVTISLVVWPPPSLTRTRLGISVTLQLVAIVSSIAVQIPLQMQLRELGPTEDLLTRLMWTDLAFRKLPLAANATLWLVSVKVV